MNITEAQLKDMLEEAALAGAKRALEQLGLHDADAARDVGEMRGLLEAWRDVRRTAWQTFIQSVVKGLLLVIVLGTTAYIWRNTP